MQMNNKDNIIAGVLSFFLPGLGQLYQSRNSDALWFFFVWLITLILCITAPVALFIWIWCIFDAVTYQPDNKNENT